jgi:hypothetical protein
MKFAEKNGIDLFLLLARHVNCDWGDVCMEDAAENDLAVKDGNRLLSCYKFNAGRVWIITEWDRSSTTFLQPEEY